MLIVTCDRPKCNQFLQGHKQIKGSVQKSLFIVQITLGSTSCFCNIIILIELLIQYYFQ